MALFQGLANQIIQNLRGGGGNTSNTSTSTSTTSTPATNTNTNNASNNRRPTPGRGNYGTSTSTSSTSTTTSTSPSTTTSTTTNRNNSAGAQALNQQISSNTSPSTNTSTGAGTGNAKIDNFVSAVKENVSNSANTPKTTVTEQMRSDSEVSPNKPSSASTEKTQNQASSTVISTIIEDKPITVTEKMRENVPKVDYTAKSDYVPVKSTAQTKTTDNPLYDVPIIGDAILTAESIIWNPDGTINKDGGLFYSHPGTLTQAEKYDIYDGSGAERMTAGANTIVNLVGSAVLPGAGGAVLKGGQIGLRELGKAAVSASAKEAAERGLMESVIIGGNRFAGFMTKPMVKTNSGLISGATTPATIPINAGSGVVLADATKDTVEKTTQYGLGIGALTAAGYGLSFGVGGVTAHQAQKIVNKADDAVRTKGLIEIRQEPGLDTENVIYRPAFTSEGLPLGKGQTLETVEESFRENRLIPKPYESTFKGEGDNSLNELYHTVPAKLPSKNDDDIQIWHASPEDIKGDMTIKGSKSEFPGLYGSPRPLSYFSKVEQWSNPHLSLMPFVTQYKPAVSPSFVHISMPKDTKFTKKPTQTAEPQLHTPLIKEEYEAILIPGTELRASETRYAINVNGRKLPVREKVYAGFTPQPKQQTRKTKGDSRKSSEYESDKDSSIAYGVSLSYHGINPKNSGESGFKDGENALFIFNEEIGESYKEAFGGASRASNPLRSGSPAGTKKGGVFASSIGEEYGKASSIYHIEDDDDRKEDKRKKASRKVKTDTFFVSRGISDAFDMVGSSLLPKVKKKNLKKKVASEFWEMGDKTSYKMTIHNSQYKSFPLPELKTRKTRKTTNKRRSKK